MSTETLISIIIPACNEEKAVGSTVKQIRDLSLANSEIIVVDDGSSDGTAREAKSAGATVMSHPYNIGNGAAVKSGIRSAHGRVLILLDGDGQHDPKDILMLLPHIAEYHMVVGARSHESETHLHRNLANRIYNLFASFIAQFKIQDLTSGFRIIRRADALRFCDMFPNGFSYPTTSTLAFLRSGRTVKYVPIKTRFRQGKSKIRLLRDGVEFFLIIVKIAMSFSPLRVFIPISSFLFFLGIARYIQTYLTVGQFTNMSHLLINSSVIVFMLGLIAEQIASMRLEKGDKLHEPEEVEKYSVFSRRETAES
ncbi:MAG: glycosyl transferase [Proteobacteria bacterium]|nr:MAG: glycosyl transferase [Pseudomonadota bacterium]